MSDADKFDSKLKIFRADCEQAKINFIATLGQLLNNTCDKSEAIRGLFNALTAVAIEVANAKERLGLIGAVDATRAIILDSFEDFGPANFGVAGNRLAAVGAAYTIDFRPAMGTYRESRMQAALTFAARIEQGSTLPEMAAEVFRGLEPSYDLDAVEKGAVAVAQSLKRLRNNLRKKEYYRFDPDTLRLEFSKPEDELWGDLPKGRGRPKSKRT